MENRARSQRWAVFIISNLPPLLPEAQGISSASILTVGPPVPDPPSALQKQDHRSVLCLTSFTHFTLLLEEALPVLAFSYLFNYTHTHLVLVFQNVSYITTKEEKTEAVTNCVCLQDDWGKPLPWGRHHSPPHPTPGPVSFRSTAALLTLHTAQRLCMPLLANNLSCFRSFIGKMMACLAAWFRAGQGTVIKYGNPACQSPAWV